MKIFFALLSTILLFCCCTPDSPADEREEVSGQAMLDSLEATYLKVKPATYMLQHPEKDSVSSYFIFSNKTVEFAVFVCIIEVFDDGGPDKRLFMTSVAPKQSELFILQKIDGATLKVVTCYIPVEEPIAGKNDRLDPGAEIDIEAPAKSIVIDTIEVKPYVPLRNTRNFFAGARSGV